MKEKEEAISTIVSVAASIVRQHLDVFDFELPSYASKKTMDRIEQECERLNTINRIRANNLTSAYKTLVRGIRDEKAALKEAVSAIYFNDNSDYLSALYGVVRALTGLNQPSEEDIKKLFKELNPE